MPAGTQITGVDGVIKIGATNEIPCLKSWTFSAQSAIETVDTKCMKSNNDGGSSAAGGFAKKVAGTKSANLEASFAWQESDTVGAQGDLRTTDVGKTVAFDLYPNDTIAGKRVISGNAIIASVGIPSEVNGVIQQNVTFEVDGEWTDDVVA